MKISENLYTEIKTLIETARESIVKSVNWAMVITHWEIGRRIVEEEQPEQVISAIFAFLRYDQSHYTREERS